MGKIIDYREDDIVLLEHALKMLKLQVKVNILCGYVDQTPNECKAIAACDRHLRRYLSQITKNKDKWSSLQDELCSIACNVFRFSKSIRKILIEEKNA